MVPQSNLAHQQGSFGVCAQPMKDNITMYCQLPFAERTHSMIPT